MHDVYILSIAIIAALACGTLGVFLVLRKMAMMSDAIAHAVLPGIAIAFILTSSKSSFIMLLAASIVGLLVTFMIQYASSTIKLQSDASIGMHFTWMFSIGIILITYYSKKVDLDPDCVIYGEISYAPFDLWITNSGINMGPRAIYSLGFSLILNLLFVIIGYKALKITTFDPDFSKSLGINVSLWHYLLMALTSFTTVSTFDIAGVVLSVSFIVVPPATAYLLTNDLKKMLLLTYLLAAISCLLGYFLAVIINGSIAPAISTTAGVLFALVLIYVRYSNKRI